MTKRQIVEVLVRLCTALVLLVGGLMPSAASASTSPSGLSANLSMRVSGSSGAIQPLRAQAKADLEASVLAETPTPAIESSITPSAPQIPTPPSTSEITPTEFSPSAETPEPTETRIPTTTQPAGPAPTDKPEASPTASATSQAPLLTFDLSVAPQQAAPGDEVVFTIRVVNIGNSAATGIQFSNTLPDKFAGAQNGFKDFGFDPQTRLLTWGGDQKLDHGNSQSNVPQTSLLALGAGETFTLQYSVRVDSPNDEFQVVDFATLGANGLPAPLVAEATLTVLATGKEILKPNAQDGQALGMSGTVQIKLPQNASNAAINNGILIRDLKDQYPVSGNDPWIAFGLDLVNLNDGNSLQRSQPSTTTPSKPDGSTASSSVIEQDQIIPIQIIKAKFAQPVELTISFNGLADLSILGADVAPYLVTLDEASGVWVRVPLKAIDREANTITSEVAHFSTWGAGIGPSFPQNGANILLFDSAYPSLSTGRSRYSLPIWTPPGRKGMTPSLALSYSSGVADGVLGAPQDSWVGMGWSVDSVEIARKITNGNCNPCGGGYFGYKNEFLLLFNGIGYELIPDGITLGRYHTKAESYLYIQLHNDNLGNNSPPAQNAGGEWWEVVERNGTRWRLGWNADAEQRAAMVGYPGAATGAWASLGYAGHATDVVALRWRVDQVTDTYGNGTSFAYFEEYGFAGGASNALYDTANYIDTVTYTSHISGNPLPGYSVVFLRVDRNDGEVRAQTNTVDNWDSYMLGRIEVRYGATVVRAYDLDYSNYSYNDDGETWVTRELGGVQISGNGTTAPHLSFTYVDKNNRANCGSGCQEWAYPRLATISNGSGAIATYTYGNDGRPNTSWYNWRVETFDVTDGVNASPMKTTFAYITPCYSDPTAGWCNGSNVGELIGYGQTTVTTKDFNGTTTLGISIHKFHTDAQKAGREYEVQNLTGGGTTLSKTNTTYTVVTTGLPAGGYFTYASAVEQYLLAASLIRISRTEYEYDTTTGNMTREKELTGAPILYRQTDYEYVTNTSPSVWILNTASRRVLKNASGTTLSTQEYGYDGNLPTVGSPTVGSLTLSRVVDGSQTSDTGYIYDTYGNLVEMRLYQSYGITASQPTSTYLTYSTVYDTALKTYARTSSNPLLQGTITEYDYGLGLPTLSTDLNGNTTTTVYDGLGRVTQVTYPGYGQPNVKYTYPTFPFSAPGALELEVWDEPAGIYRAAWQILDGLGRVIQTQGAYQTTGSLILSDSTYNALGLALNQGQPRTLAGAGGSYFAPNWSSIPHTMMAYDALQRTTAVVYPDASQETFTYSGLRTTTIDRNSHQKIQEKDSFGRLVKVEEYTGSGTYTLYATTSYSYDERDLLKTTIDAQSNQMTINYDGFGRKTSMSDPDMGTWYYHFDALGNLNNQQDARGQVICLYYDNLNRLRGKHYRTDMNCPANPALNISYSYDDTTGGNQGIGRRTSMSDDSGSTSWFYNSLGQATHETRTIDGINYETSITDDAFGRPMTQNIPSGETLNYTYNSMGMLSSLSGTSTYLSQINYSPDGQVMDQRLGNGLVQQLCYENLTLRLSAARTYPGTLQSCALANPSNARLNLAYTYQLNGNISMVVDSTRNETVNYSYDELDRLQGASGPSGQGYTYDPIGNITGVNSPPDIVAITGGYAHTCAVTTSGGVACWGLNNLGQLGDNTTIGRDVPINVSGLSNGVTAVSAGGYHTCALTSGGGVKCWGHNGYGQLGDGTLTQRLAPVDVGGLTSGVNTIATGFYHTCALTTAGGVKCWGLNDHGQLGDGTTTLYRSTPVDVNGLTSGVIAIATTYNHTCALTTAGGVKCWGYNSNGQLGDGTTTQRLAPVDVSGLTSGVTAIAAGHAHTCALMAGGGVKCWGLNSYGELGDGTNTQRLAPVDVSGLTNGATAIATGGYHTCALTPGGGLKCWGQNTYGQLGDGTTTWRLAPVDVTGQTNGIIAIAAGRFHTCDLTTNGEVECWGENHEGQLGDGTTYRTTPVSVTGLTGSVTIIAANVAAHTCAVVAGGIKCWGGNYQGQLGIGTSGPATDQATPVDVSGLTSGMATVGVSYSHSCAVTTGGGVKCWGDNVYGQLGDGTINQRTTPVNVSGLSSGIAFVSPATNHTCARTTGGGVKCWGYNKFGQLGDGTTTQRTTPVNVSGLTSGVTAISAGGLHTCAITTAGGVKCWGYNANGELGDGTTTYRTAPVNVNGLTSGVIAISSGSAHTCALLSSGAVKCWGANSTGQLGDGTTTQRTTPVSVSGLTSGVIAIAAGGGHTCALVTGGTVKCWGNNSYGQLGDGTTIQRNTPVSVSGLLSGVTALTTGETRTCAVITGGVKCWGDNSYGQIGEGVMGYRTTAVTPLFAFSISKTYIYGDPAHKHAVNSLSTGEGYTYDANGNMITRVEDGLTYIQAFDAENHLVSVTVNSQTTQFIYDGDGNLVKKINPDSTKAIYVGGVYEEDRNSGGAVTHTKVYYPAGGAMRVDGTLYYVLQDQLASASVVTDASGLSVGEQRYYPFGETRLATGSMLTDHLFTGQREMTGLGVYHFGARFYSPKLARFLSADTIVPGSSNPQAFNRYSYVNNAPTMFTDPTGHSPNGTRVWFMKAYGRNWKEYYRAWNRYGIRPPTWGQPPTRDEQIDESIRQGNKLYAAGENELADEKFQEVVDLAVYLYHIGTRGMRGGKPIYQPILSDIFGSPLRGLTNTDGSVYISHDAMLGADTLVATLAEESYHTTQLREGRWYKSDDGAHLNEFEAKNWVLKNSNFFGLGYIEQTTLRDEIEYEISQMSTDLQSRLQFMSISENYTLEGAPTVAPVHFP